MREERYNIPLPLPLGEELGDPVHTDLQSENALGIHILRPAKVELKLVLVSLSSVHRLGTLVCIDTTNTRTTAC